MSASQIRADAGSGEQPWQSRLFRDAGDARVRRQIIRWLLHDQRGKIAIPPDIDAPDTLDNAIIDVMRTALQDNDWEVQVTAMLAVGQLDLIPLRSAIDQLRLPSPGASGLTRADCQVLAAARQVVIASLNRVFTENNLADALTRMPGVPLSFARCVLGLPIDQMDAACLLIASLTTPVPPMPDVPPVLPPSIVYDNHGLRLRGLPRDDALMDRVSMDGTSVDEASTDGSYIEMIWIPPVAHWLGNGLDAPIRTVMSLNGYLIAKHPLTVDQIRALDRTPTARTSSGIALGTYDEARQWCLALTRYTGTTVSLPTSDQWEMATRGPDGRRYPWGNNIERTAFMRNVERIYTIASPWGVRDTVGVAGQWTQLDAEAGIETAVYACGTPGDLRATARHVVDRDACYAVRLVVTL
jgi:hypothetical protein